MFGGSGARFEARYLEEVGRRITIQYIYKLEVLSSMRRFRLEE
jgi:hypothetical protein